MEKRTVLAFVLSFIVLIGWSYLFAPKQDQTPQKVETTDKAAPKPIPKVAESPVPPRILQPEKPQKDVPGEVRSVQEKRTEIDTPLYHAVFSNVGPTLTSFRLKKYRETIDPNSPLIELVHTGEGGDAFLLMNFKDPTSNQKTKLVYEVDHDFLRLGAGSASKDLVFHSSTPDGLVIKQTFRFHPDQYRIDHSIDIFNQSQTPIKGAFTAEIKAMPPEEKQSYYSYVGMAILLDGKLKEVKIKKASEEKVLAGRIDWVSYEDDFFISAVIPDETLKGSFRAKLLPSGLLVGTYLGRAASLNTSERASSRHTLYFGPRDMGVMKELGKGLEKAVNFGFFDIIAKPLLWLLRFFNGYINNFGFSIILLTILIKILFWPLTHKSYKSMKGMQKLQPRMAKIREKYKDDKQKLNQEMMALYKTYKVNPMGGCLPMVIQIPVFFALFRLLGNSIELRQAPFMLWINDLSAPDRLFNFNVPFHVPLMAPPYGIPVLTLLMGASMFIQQKMTPTPGDPTQAKIMMFLPIIFTFMFINFPSGLVLYWLVNNILSIGQQYRINKKPG